MIVTAVADSGMCFDTLTSIGAGSAGASGGTSACATCTKAGGGGISLFPSLWPKATEFYLGDVLVKSTTFQDIFNPLTIDGDWNCRPQSNKKGGLVTKSPFITYSLALRS